MLWNERGVLPASRIYFLQPNASSVEDMYRITCFGTFQCNHEYCVHRYNHYTSLFMFITDGTMKVTTGGKIYYAYPNQIVLLDCRSEHRYEAVDHCSFSFFHFDGPDVDNIHTAVGPVISPPDVEWFEEHLSLLQIKLMNSLDVDEFEISGFIHAVICKLRSTKLPDNQNYAAPEKLIYRACKYIKEHITESISREDLAQELNISRDYLSHIFRSEMGCSPIEYHACQRIEYSKSVLIYSTASVTEISDLLGFSSPASFINAFKARCNTTPLQYRNSHLKKQ